MSIRLLQVRDEWSLSCQGPSLGEGPDISPSFSGRRCGSSSSQACLESPSALPLRIPFLYVTVKYNWRRASIQRASLLEEHSFCFMKVRALWSVIISNCLPRRYGRKCLQAETIARPSFSMAEYLRSRGRSFLEK